MAVQKTTGRGGSLTLKGNVITITSWTAKGSKELADSTDSANYDPNSGQLWKSQQPGALAMEVSVEGNFDLSSTSANIIQLLKTDPPVDVILNITPTVKYCEANFDLSDVETKLSVPGGTMVTFSANLKSNGVVTLF
jgi:hypothetical protein